MSTYDDSHLPSREQLVAATSKPMPAAWTWLSVLLIAVGVVVFGAGAAKGEDRVWQALLVNWLFFVSISQAATVFVAVQRITTARWSRPVVRMLEGFTAFLGIAFWLLVLIFLGRAHIFPWARGIAPTAEKALWLRPGFLITRDLALMAILVALSVRYVWLSVRLDVGVLPDSGTWGKRIRDRMRRGFRDERRELHDTHQKQGRLAVILALCFGLFMSVFAWDLSMSLDLHFQSTLYSWWFFMGGWLGMLMAWSLLVMWWRRHLSAEDLITEHIFHDLGKLCFAFTAFWGYLTFGQYLVIWYGNMGEETHFPRLRLIQPWVGLTVTVLFLMFVIPFFGLLSRAAKVWLPTFFTFAVGSLVGLWMLRYLEVYPSLHGVPARAPFGLWEVGVTAGMLGLWMFAYSRFMTAFPRMRIVMMTSPYRDEVQVPVNPETMEPLPAHE
ncbi:MAG TPA: hypothetical protein VMT93_02385 [Gemmatimonadaceae bacterium]|nr:hypothetical protein [Gemmatimonadaceae bacterium]